MTETNGADSVQYQEERFNYDLLFEMIKAWQKKLFVEVRNDPYRKEKIFTVIINGNYRLGDTDNPAKLIHEYLETL